MVNETGRALCRSQGVVALMGHSVLDRAFDDVIPVAGNDKVALAARNEKQRNHHPNPKPKQFHVEPECKNKRSG
ncbi:hypothetical protein WICPIJ_007083 [Wickerhamomyces pijperi]|uniref:Uncharacterized protein n=1 Tax=Wickerhamomyces pijperi TaxID=599730 RepID=A0A9P8TKS8_WICPI|nr:hypothetical protein WICPIJ_007083 [Wickerhamomyces pijperi]